MIVGVKYIIGSVEEKADYKEKILPIVIGVCLISGIFVIVDAIYGAVTTL